MTSKFLSHEAKRRCRELRARQTAAEEKLWSLVRNRRCLGLKFYRQRALYYQLGTVESFFIADFYCSELRLVIELDGPIHEDRTEFDSVRDDVLEMIGMRVLRFPNSLVLENPEAVIEEIRCLVLESKT